MRERERERLSSAGVDSFTRLQLRGLARLKPGARSTSRIVHMGSSGLSTWATSQLHQPGTDGT